MPQDTGPSGIDLSVSAETHTALGRVAPPKHIKQKHVEFRTVAGAPQAQFLTVLIMNISEKQNLVVFAVLTNSKYKLINTILKLQIHFQFHEFVRIVSLIYITLLCCMCGILLKF